MKILHNLNLFIIVVVDVFWQFLLAVFVGSFCWQFFFGSFCWQFEQFNIILIFIYSIFIMDLFFVQNKQLEWSTLREFSEPK
jgi:hypothetical protein